MARVLIIDDDEAFLQGLAETLRSLGHEVLEAERVGTGLSMIERERPDAIFLDFRMPDMDGIAALRRLRQDYGPDMPAVVMLTAHAQQREYDRGDEARRVRSPHQASGTG